jgi:hypothetical protein
MTLGFIGSRPSRCNFLRASLRGAANGFRLLSDFPFKGFLVMAAKLDLAKDALALHLLFQHPEGLGYIVVADENLHDLSFLMYSLLKA